jgi:quinoprotein dehydrogenase-associated probable ABC transporter substrate-binding protein
MRPLATFMALATLAAPSFVAAQTSTDLVSRTELRVCADPHDLPFSNQEKQGVENKVAALLGHDAGLTVSYTWFPDSQGFVRATLMRHLCDVVMGTVSGVGDMDTTDSYYHTGYVMVTRAADNLKATSVGDPSLAAKKFGLVARTPPTDLLVKHNLLDQTKFYPLVVDTRVEQPTHEMLQDLVDKKIDVALLWGPFAGYYIKHDNLPLKLTVLDAEPGIPRLDYHIAIGLRPSDAAFRRKLSQLVVKDQDKITQILRDDGIPLLDEHNHLIASTPDAKAP